MNKDKLNILQLRSHAGFYGAERMVIDLAEGLQRKGHSVTIGIIQRARESDFTFQEIAEKHGLPCAVFDSCKPYDRNTVKQVGEFIAREHPDLIHSHGYKADVTAWMAHRSFHLPLLSTCHPWLHATESWRAALYTIIDKLVLLDFDRVVAINQHVRQQCRIGPFKNRTIRVIANGVAIHSADPSAMNRDVRKELNLPPGCIVLGSVARLTNEKGHKYLIKAFAEVVRKADKPAALLLAGEGNEMDALQKLSRDLHVDENIHFLGHQADILSLLRQMDVFVLPSLTEGVPLALLEAMAAAVPAIATAVGDVPLILDQGRAGLIVPPGEVHALAEAILDLIGDEDKRRRLATVGPERIETAYSLMQMCQAYEEEYYSLCGQREGAS